MENVLLEEINRVRKLMNLNEMVITHQNNNVLTEDEQKLIDGILLSLNEGLFDSTINKIKDYAKKGLLTTAMLSSLLLSPNLTYGQKKQIQSTAQKEITNQYNWWLSYIQSPQYLQRLQKEFPNKDKKWIENERNIRLNNLKNAKNKTHLVKSIGSEPGIFLGVAIPKQYEGESWDDKQQKWVKRHWTKDKKGYDKPGNVYLEKGFADNYGYETTPAHELGHAVDDGGYRIPQATKEKIYKYTKGGGDYKEYKSGNMEFDYFTTPTEFINRLQPVRFLLQKEKIYDANTKDFTEQDYNKMLTNPNIKNNEHFKEIMDSLKGNDLQKKKNFIDLMNTIASNNIKMPTQQDISNLA